MKLRNCQILPAVHQVEVEIRAMEVALEVKMATETERIRATEAEQMPELALKLAQARAQKTEVNPEPAQMQVQKTEVTLEPAQKMEVRPAGIIQLPEQRRTQLTRRLRMTARA